MRFRLLATGLSFFGGLLAACGLAIEGGYIAESDGGPITGDEPTVDAHRPEPPSNFDAGDAAVELDVSILYAHTPDTLYRLDPQTNRLIRVGAFAGDCETGGIIDIAIDGTGRAYATSFSAFHELDLASAVCRKIADGAYPNALAFVRRGDGGGEDLVGYSGSTYSRIDPNTGENAQVGTLTGGYLSSGDLVELPDGGVFLTVTGNGCGDCLLRVDPTSGDVVENLGSVKHENVWGLAWRGERIYGFTSEQGMFSVERVDGGLVTTEADAGGVSSFYGAASALIPAKAAAALVGGVDGG